MTARREEDTVIEYIILIVAMLEVGSAEIFQEKSLSGIQYFPLVLQGISGGAVITTRSTALLRRLSLAYHIDGTLDDYATL